MSAKVRQKHLEYFPELITEYGKAKRHSMEETVKNNCVGIFLDFRRKSSRETETGESG